MSDYYEFLGVKRDASKEDIRAAFRSISFDFHPDRNSGHPEAPEFYQIASEAYQVLSNDDARRAYDAALAGQVASGSSQRGLTLHDILEGLSTVTGVFMEVMARAKVAGKVPKDVCHVCHGSKSLTLQLGPLSIQKECDHCAGSGRAPAPKQISLPRQ